LQDACCSEGDTLLGPIGVPASIAILLLLGALAGAALAALAFWLRARKRRRYDAEFRERFGGGMGGQLPPQQLEAMVKRAATPTFRAPAVAGAGAGAPGASRLPRTAAALREGPLEVGVASSLTGLPAALRASGVRSEQVPLGLTPAFRGPPATGLDASASVIIREAGLDIHVEGCDDDDDAGHVAAKAAPAAGAPQGGTGAHPAPALRLPPAARTQATPCKEQPQLCIEVGDASPLDAAPPSESTPSPPSCGASANPFATTRAARAAHRAAARELLGAFHGDEGGGDATGGGDAAALDVAGCDENRRAARGSQEQCTQHGGAGDDGLQAAQMGAGAGGKASPPAKGACAPRGPAA
jgi:hypothetical protein